MSRRIMVVAGGEWQVPIVRTAKSMGYFVVNTNLHVDSPGFRYADVGLVADVLDREKNLAYAREYCPDGIVTDQSDIAVPTVAYVCEQLGLPGIGIDHAELFTNKTRMRIFLREHGFDTPAFRVCKASNEILEFARHCGYPMVMKPPANQSSRGVFRVDSDQDVVMRYGDVLQHSRDGAVLVEQFINGTELTVEGFKTRIRHYTLAISRKTHYEHNPMVASALFYSPEDPDIDYRRLASQHDAMVEAMGLPFGITHAEYICVAGRFFLVEVAARGGGTKISSHIVPAVSGVPTNSLLISMAMGQSEDTLCPSPPPPMRYAVLSFFNFPPGLVRAVEGVSKARSLPGVVDIEMNFRPGQTLKAPLDDRGRHGYYIAVGTTRGDVIALGQEIRAAVKVDYA